MRTRHLWHASRKLGLLLAALGLALAGCSGQQDLLGQIKARGSIRVSTDPNYAPQSFLDDQGELQGFDIDVAKEIARRLGVKARFVTPEWDRVMVGNWGGEWDMVVESATITPERKQVLYFSPPYYYTPAQFAVRADLTGVTNVKDLNGHTICVGTSTTYEQYLQGTLKIEDQQILDQANGAKIQALASDAECIQAIKAGSGAMDGVLTALPVVEEGIKAGAPIRKIGKPVFYESLAVAMDKSAPNSDSLVSAVSKIVEDMHRDGTLSQLSMKWYQVDLTIKQ